MSNSIRVTNEEINSDDAQLNLSCVSAYTRGENPQKPSFCENGSASLANSQVPSDCSAYEGGDKPEPHEDINQLHPN